MVVMSLTVSGPGGTFGPSAMLTNVGAAVFTSALVALRTSVWGLALFSIAGGLLGGLFLVLLSAMTFNCCETATATLLFATESTRRLRIYSPPAIDAANGTIYFGASRGAKTTFFAIDLAGNVKWEKVLPRTNFRNTPPVIDAAGNVYVVARQKMLAFKPNGDPLFEYEARDPFFSGLVLGNGRLYAGSSRGRVYAIGDCPP